MMQILLLHKSRASTGVCVIFLFLLKRFLSLAKEKKSIVCFKA